MKRIMVIEMQPRNTHEWDNILASDNYEEAFNKCATYIANLQNEVDEYRSLYEKERKRANGLTIDDIIKENVLDNIREKERNRVYESEKDWSGIQEGL